MSLAVREHTASPKVPIAKIKFKLDACIYQKVGEKYERIENRYVPRHTVHDVVEIIDDSIFILSTGEIVQSFSNNPATLIFGKLLIHKDGVDVFSRNGLLQRKVSKGQSFNVYAIHETPIHKTVRYQINQKEWILSGEGVEFLKGYFKPLEKLTVVHKGTPILLNPNKSYAYHQVNGTKILLNRFDDLWIDINVCKGSLESV